MTADPSNEDLAGLLDVARAAMERVQPGGVLSGSGTLSAALFALYRIVPAFEGLLHRRAEEIGILRARIEDLQAEGAALRRELAKGGRNA